MGKVFISYKRSEEAFVRRLDQGLRDHGLETWVDLTGIPVTAVFMDEIRLAIEGAEGVVFVISPDSVESDVCGQEVELAVDLNKRLIPIVRREVGRREMAPALSERHWIFFREEDDFSSALETLITAIATDLDWVKTHTRLTVRAAEWERRGRNLSYLLRGVDLTEAEHKLATADAGQEPRPTPVQREYVLASRRAATVRKRWLQGGVATALVVALILGGLFLWQRNRAEERKLAARRLYYGEVIGNADKSVARGDSARARADLNGQQEDMRGFEWYYLQRRLRGGGRDLFTMTDPTSDPPRPGQLRLP